MKILTKYMFRQLVPNYLIGLSFFTIMFLVNQVFLLVKYIVERNVAPGKVGALFVYSFPQILALTIPISSVIAAILTFGQLSSSSEVVALRGSGISLMRIIRPNLIFGVVLTLGTLLFYDTVLPRGVYQYAMKRRQILMGDPLAEFEPRQVISLGGQSIRYESENPQTGEMFRIYITSRDGSITFARRGKFMEKQETADKLLLRFKLHDVTIQEYDERDPTQLIKTTAPVVIHTFVEQNKQVQQVMRNARTMNTRQLYEKIQKENFHRYKQISQVKKQLSGLESRADSYRKQQEKIKQQLQAADKRSAARRVELQRSQRRIKGRLAAAQRQVKSYSQRLARLEKIPYRTRIDLYEFHRKFSLPAACLIFVLVGAPLGMFSRRSGKSMGLGLGVLVVVIYYVLLVIGQGWVLSDKIGPFTGAWLPDMFLGVVGGGLILKKLKE